MRVLFITFHYLSDNGGGVFASRSFVNALREIYGDVTLMCPVRSGTSPKGIDPRIRLIPVEDRRSSVRKLLDIVCGRLHVFYAPLRQLLKEEYFDVVVYDTSYPSAGTLSETRKTGARIVTIHHNWQYAYVKESAEWPLRPFILFYVWLFEKKAVRGSDLNIALTAQDRESLYQAYDPGRKSRIEICPPFEYELR